MLVSIWVKNRSSFILLKSCSVLIFLASQWPELFLERSSLLYLFDFSLDRREDLSDKVLTCQTRYCLVSIVFDYGLILAKKTIFPCVNSKMLWSLLKKLLNKKCNFFFEGVGLLLHYIRTGKTTDDIIKMSFQFCVSLKIQTHRVCDGITQLFGVSILVYVFLECT